MKTFSVKFTLHFCMANFIRRGTQYVSSIHFFKFSLHKLAIWPTDVKLACGIASIDASLLYLTMSVTHKLFTQFQAIDSVEFRVNTANTLLNSLKTSIRKERHS